MLGLLWLFAIAAALIALLGTVGLIHALHHPRRKTYAVALAKGDPTEPADLELAAEEATFSLADGTTTPGWLVDGAAADGPTVVIVHGFGDSRYGALTWAPLFVPFASRIVVYDQRGQGESKAKRSGLGVREPDDLLEVLDQLPPGDARPIVLFGYSQGANTAIAAAARAADRVAGVIADGPFRFWYEPVARVMRCRGYPSQPFIWLAHTSFALCRPQVARIDRAEDAAALQCPLLVLHSRDDPVCPFASGRAIADAAPRGALVEFADCTHNQLAVEQPEKYRTALAEFFADLAGAPPKPDHKPATHGEPT